MIVSEARINAMIAEGKALRQTVQTLNLIPRPHDGHLVQQHNLEGALGTQFQIHVRQNHSVAEDFSVILVAVLAPPIATGRPEFRLLRYDGGGHTHKNSIEGNTILRAPHIHRATERYQRYTNQRRPDGYAEATLRYVDIAGAWHCFCADINLTFM